MSAPSVSFLLLAEGTRFHRMLLDYLWDRYLKSNCPLIYAFEDRSQDLRVTEYVNKSRRSGGIPWLHLGLFRLAKTVKV
jgi:hypothetical protein